MTSGRATATMRRWTIGAALLLAACSGEPEPVRNTMDTGTEATPPPSSAPSTPEVTSTVPTRFVGTWDIDATACTATPPGARRTVVAADSLAIGGDALAVHAVTAAEAGAVDIGVLTDRSGITAQRRYRLALGTGGTLEATGDGVTTRLLRCDAPAGAQAAARNAVALNLAPDGLTTVAGASSRPVPFGTPAEVVLRVVEAATQTLPERSTNRDCGEGPLEIAAYPRLRVYFQDGRFVGWAARGRGLTTAGGVGIGTPRAQVESVIDAPVSDTSLGQGFAAGGLSGLYDARDVVSELWAGSTCLAR